MTVPTATAPAPTSAAVRRSFLVMGALLYVTGTIGSNIGPALIDDHPAAVLALSSRNRNLFAAVPYIDWLPYALIGFVRLAVVAVVLYYIGAWFGTHALAWTETQLGELPAVYRWVQSGVDRAGWLLVLLMPGSNIVCLLAGHRRMAMRLFLPLLSAGIVVKLVVLWIGGHIFEDQIRWFLNAIERYQWWIVGGLFAISIAQSLHRAKVSPPSVREDDPHG